MRKFSLLLIPILFWGCGRQELIEDVDDRESVYERIRTKVDQRIASIGELHCLGELCFTGGTKFYVTLDCDSQGGALEVFSLLRQKLGWVRFNSDTTTYSFDDPPELLDLGGLGFLVGWTLIGYPPFSADVQILKLGESSHSLYIAVKNRDLLYYFRILKEPMVLLSMKVKRGESTMEVNFRNHRDVGGHFFPYLITGSTPLGDFELRYLEVSDVEK